MFQEQAEPDQDFIKSLLSSNTGLFIIIGFIWRTSNRVGATVKQQSVSTGSRVGSSPNLNPADPSADSALKVLPSDGKFLPMLFGISAVVADIWTIYPRVRNWILVLISGSLLVAYIHKQYPKMAIVVALQILVVLWINPWTLFDILRLLLVASIGYTYQSQLIRAWEVFPSSIFGKTMIGLLLAADLTYMNVNLKLFITSVTNGSILLTIWYYAILYGIGVVNMFVCFWMHPKTASWERTGAIALLRLASLMLIYVFYNPLGFIYE